MSSLWVIGRNRHSGPLHFRHRSLTACYLIFHSMPAPAVYIIAVVGTVGVAIAFKEVLPNPFAAYIV